ncbi:MAG: hypothetical protein OS130_04695 [Thermodesulfobacteriota bacterium]|jgi:hypothetical protein|nr:MAG: hypothetical protein OS130_04695 [Thermodesulfobacteriota bacterium]
MKSKYNIYLKEGVDFNVKEKHWFPQKMNIEYIVVGKSIYCRGYKGKISRHEFLHLAQFKKYGTVIVLMHYIYYGIKNLIKYRKLSTAFREIPFEIEARTFASEAEER